MKAPEPSPRPGRQWRPWRPWLLAFGLWLSLVALAALALWHLRREAIDGQTRELGLLSLALTDEIDRGLRGTEEGLIALRAELRDGRLPLAGDPATAALHTRADLMPLARTLWLLDHGGAVLAASDTTPPPSLAAFVPALASMETSTLSLSRPFQDPATGQALVAAAMAFDPAPGRAGGWIVVALPASALLGAFTVALPAADARMVVFRGDGARLAVANGRAPLLDDASVARRLAGRPGLELHQARDGSQSLVGLHAVPRYGIKVLVSRDLAAVLVAWRETAGLATAALALLAAILVAAVQFARRADRRRAQAQLALQTQISRASRLESLGTLAGGVAHDFNNLLAAIVGFGEMAQDAAAPGSSQARHLDRVLQAALRGKALVERILAFSRGGARISTVFMLESVVIEVLTLLSATLRPGLVLERGLQAPGARLRGDPTQAFEAAMNLCSNALQAMPRGGMLSVQLERVHVDTARSLSHTPLAAGDYVALSVSDQGEGITPEVMEHLFEPFFTTRGAESGTGLGLAVVHGVVAEFGGAIDVTSCPGHGARFVLYFPECTDELAATEPLGEDYPGGTGQSVLVVDDDPHLVALGQELLTSLGYAPVGFTDPVEALEAVRAAPGRFAAVITDEVMPGLTGTQLTEALHRHAPTLPVLLLSGYGGALLAQRAAAAGVIRVLSKPLQRATLARALAQLLH